MHKGWIMRRLLTLVLAGTLLVGAWSHAGEMRKAAGRVVLMLSATVTPGSGREWTAGEGRLTLLDGTTQTTSEHHLPPWGMKPTVLDHRNMLDLHMLTRTH
jgi:hypothetical protein